MIFVKFKNKNLLSLQKQQKKKKNFFFDFPFENHSTLIKFHFVLIKQDQCITLASDPLGILYSSSSEPYIHIIESDIYHIRKTAAKVIRLKFNFF